MVEDKRCKWLREIVSGGLSDLGGKEISGLPIEKADQRERKHSADQLHDDEHRRGALGTIRPGEWQRLESLQLIHLVGP